MGKKYSGGETLNRWIRLYITGEGQTEVNFAKKILDPHLNKYHIHVIARSVLTGKSKRRGEFRGGLIDYAKAKYDIRTLMKEDNNPECRFTTMFDLYALPENFPGYREARKIDDPYKRVHYLEDAFGEDINDSRFIPYLQLYEFETLIFTNPQKLDREYLEHDKPISNLVEMVGDKNPELINDGKDTAPSKRILREIPEYDKTTAGISVVQEIGLDTLRQKCKHFDDWIQLLEKLHRIKES